MLDFDLRGGEEMCIYAEDDDDIRTLAIKVLTDAGYRLVPAMDG